MRRATALLLATAVLCGAAGSARAVECDLDSLIGYTLVTAKTIEGYIDEGARKSGFQGCRVDRILVFTDNTGVRCKVFSLQTGNLPRAWLFARGDTELRLCVGGELLEVGRAR